jgi:hypothetical protein
MSLGVFHVIFFMSGELNIQGALCWHGGLLA